MRSGFRVQDTGCIVKKILWSLTILFFVLTLTPKPYTLSPVYADEPLSSTVLIEDAKSFDKKEITYRGEAVTAVMNRGEFSWVNLNDGANAIGVWAKRSEIEKIRSLGGYNRKGDIAEVKGIFNRACNMHKGELDIHAHSVDIIKRGYAIEKSPDSSKLKATIALFLLVILIVAIFRRRI